MKSGTTTLAGYVLSRSQRQTRHGLMLELWLSTARGPVRALVNDPSAVFFVERHTSTHTGRRRNVALRSAREEPVDAVYFENLRDLREERDRLLQAGAAVFEGDVLPSERYLMERFITGSCQATGILIERSSLNHSGGRGTRSASSATPDLRNHSELQDAELRTFDYTPELRSASIDIETDGFDGRVLSIAAVSGDVEQVFMLGDPSEPAPPLTTFLPDEAQLISAFCRFLRQLDPDLILGWNVIEFDLAVLLRRAGELGISLALGRDGSGVELTESKPARARIAGRVVLDGIGSLRAASHMLESYALSDVAERFLGRSKALDNPGADRVAEIRRMFEHDRAALARYNLEDCRLTRDVFARADLLGFLMQRAQLTGLPLDRVRGAVAAFDYLYLPRLHRAGYVASTVGMSREAASSPGGYVLDSVPGLHDNVIVLDFKSLYPSIIRTFCIDPLGLWTAHEDEHPVEGFVGARFHRNRHILPQLITQLWHSRDEAKQRQDAARSYAIKILMNSFYGILGTPACRFFDPKLASSITLRGHEIITGSKAFLEQQGYPVIYGDTDSLFVQLSRDASAETCLAQGEALARALNAHWAERISREQQLPSQLEVELDTHYLKFFMPTLRDFVQGSKKRYAGLTRTPDGQGYEVEFKGLEAVRTDWTPLARRFQRELYRRIFLGEPYVELVQQTVAALYAGQLDAELVYRKKLRRELDEYVKNVPPHVRAARKLAEPSSREVLYFMTVRGPEPLGARVSSLDYRHYIDRQLAPAADTLLHYLGTSLAELVDPQLSLF